MKVMKKVIAIMICSFMMMAALAACGNAGEPAAPAAEPPAQAAAPQDETAQADEPAEIADEQVTIRFCVNVQPQLPMEFWQSIADRYMVYRPNVTVEVIGQPGTETIFSYQQTLLATGQFPDVMVMQNAADFAAVGALLPFNDSELEFIADVDIGKINGVQYTANYKKQVIGVFYNKDLFAANGISVPTTYQQFIDNCETLMANGVLPVSIGINDGWPQIMLTNMLAGTDLLANDPNWGAKRNAGTVQFNNPDLARAMQKYQDICMKYTGGSIASITYEQMLSQFFDGTAAMLPMGSWVNAEVAKEAHDFEAGWFPMPGDNDANTLSVFVNEGLSIGAQTEHPDVAKDFIRFFFTDEELYGIFLESEQLFSTTKATVEYNMSPLRREMEALISGLNEVEGFESMTGDAAFLPGLKDYYTNIFSQNLAIGADVEAELEAFDREWEISNSNL